MIDKFDELAKGLAQSVTRRQALKVFGAVLTALTLIGVPPGIRAAATDTSASDPPTALSSTITDPAGDAVWPFEFYNGPVPPYLDIVQATVSLNQGVLHFEVQMAVDIPAIPSPGLTPSVNHLGVTVGILTDRDTSGQFNEFGQTDVYHFNFLVGGLYSFADSGIGLPIGWSGFFLDVATFTAVALPLSIRGNTLVFEIDGTSLGNPTSFQWVVVTECDPVPVTAERNKSLLLEDYAPDHDYAIWPSPSL
jgi:hypothetical protein